MLLVRISVYKLIIFFMWAYKLFIIVLDLYMQLKLQSKACIPLCLAFKTKNCFDNCNSSVQFWYSQNMNLFKPDQMY